MKISSDIGTCSWEFDGITELTELGREEAKARKGFGKDKTNGEVSLRQTYPIKIPLIPKIP
jgi:hypothetical protein